MANFKRDTLSSAGNARSNHMPGINLSASKEYPRPWQQMPPSAPPVQVSHHPTWAANPFPGRAGHHELPLPTPPNTNFAQSASSSTHSVQGPRSPNNMNRPNYAHPPPIDFWNCCRCGSTNSPTYSPVLCVGCPHRKCIECPPTPPQHMPWTDQRRHFVPDKSVSRHHS